MNTQGELNILEKSDAAVLIADMTNEQYHGDRTAVSSSGLKKILPDNATPAHYQEYLTGERTETTALRVGTAIHTAILEPDVFKAEYLVAPQVDRRTTEGKAKWKEFLEFSVGKSIVTAAELAMIQGMARQVSQHKMANTLLAMGKAEQSIFWTDSETGIRCKIRPDSLSGYAILDVKSTASAHRNNFPRSCVNYDYDLSAAMYQEGFFQLSGEKIDFVFLACEKEAPHLCALYKASEEMMASGYAKFRRALRTLAECTASGKWGGYQQDGDFELIDWPRWAQVSKAGSEVY